MICLLVGAKHPVKKIRIDIFNHQGCFAPTGDDHYALNVVMRNIHHWAIRPILKLQINHRNQPEADHYEAHYQAYACRQTVAKC